MRKVLKKPATCLEEFPQLSEREAKVIEDILCGSFVGANVGHIWIGDEGDSILYNGFVESYCKRTKSYDVAYWVADSDETYEVATEYTLRAVELAADFFVHELTV
jgi:hypothetical protein